MMKRRDLVKSFTATAGLALMPGFSEGKPAKKGVGPFTYCLNMATIRGHNLGFVKELEVASQAGFKGVEIWMESLQTYLKNGGTVQDAKRRLNDLGLQVENTIGFAPWILEDETR